MSPAAKSLFVFGIYAIAAGAALLACRPARPSAADATAGIDSLNAALVRAYRTHDPQAYAALYTDTAVFEWPAFNTVRGPAQLAAMARSQIGRASLRGRARRRGTVERG